ncbi:hypothetical protein EV426DRAFT_718629 [Tirmania nivea]|nr:hypothetical protein EV426DRAFT_718629 [Tirmania nivea]
MAENSPKEVAIATAQDHTQTKQTFSINNEERGTSTAHVHPEGSRVRKVENRWLQQVKIWWILIAQLLVTATIAACLVKLLDGYQALADAGDYFWNIPERGDYRLRISEVTTLVSASMVIVRLLVSSWTAVTVSNCVFILLEEPGLEISTLSNVMQLGLPTAWPKGRKGWAVVTVLLLLFPQQFTAPLVTGAVGWSTLAERSKHSKKVTLISRTTNVTIPRDVKKLEVCDLLEHRLIPPLAKRQTQTSDDCRTEETKEFDGVSDADWIELRDWTVFLDKVVNTKLAPRQAARLSNALWPPNGGEKLDGSNRRSCRTLLALNQPRIPVNSTAYNVDLPCIFMHNITWTGPNDSIKNLTKKENEETTRRALLTEYPAPGAAMLFNDTSESIVNLAPNGYSPDQVVQYPNPSTLASKLRVLVQLYAFRKDVTGKNAPSCNRTDLDNVTIFGSLQNVSDKAIFRGELGFYAYAEVGLTAGMVNFGEVKFVHSDVLEGTLEPSTQPKFKPDTWVRSSLLLARDVMIELSSANSNTTLIPTWGNLDGYIETLIRHSYLGSWALLRSLQSNATIFDVHLAEPRMQATVSHWRVFAWFLISLGVPVSGFVWYFGAQWTSKRNLVLNHTIATLLTDVSGVLTDPVAKDLELTNLSYVTRKDKRLKLLLGTDDMGKHSLSVIDG